MRVLFCLLLFCLAAGKKTSPPTFKPTSPPNPVVSSPWYPQSASYVRLNNTYSATVIDAVNNVYLVMSQGPVFFCAANSTSCSITFGSTFRSFQNAKGAAMDSAGRLLVVDYPGTIYSCTQAAGCVSKLDATKVAAINTENLWLYGLTFDAAFSSIYFSNYDSNMPYTANNCFPGASINCDPTVTLLNGVRNYIGKCSYTLKTGAIFGCTQLIQSPTLGFKCGPSSVKLDLSEKNFWIVCSFGGTLVTCTADGSTCANVTQKVNGVSPKTLLQPSDAVVDPFYGDVYIADTGNARVLHCSSDGTQCSLLVDGTYQVGPFGNVSFATPPVYSNYKYVFASFGYMAVSATQRTLYITDYTPTTWAVQLTGIPSPMPTPMPTIIVNNPGYLGLISVGGMLAAVLVGTVLFSRAVKPPPSPAYGTVAMTERL